MEVKPETEDAAAATAGGRARSLDCGLWALLRCPDSLPKVLRAVAARRDDADTGLPLFEQRVELFLRAVPFIFKKSGGMLAQHAHLPPALRREAEAVWLRMLRRHNLATWAAIACLQLEEAVSLRPSAPVEVHGLTSRPELNGVKRRG